MNDVVWFVNNVLLGAMATGAILFALIPKYRVYPLGIRAFVGSVIGLVVILGWCLFLLSIYGM